VADFPARLVTPEKVLFDEPVEAVILTTGVGDATFLAGHCPLVGSVAPGLVRFVRVGGEELCIAAHGGFVHVETDGRVTVLPPVAEIAEDIDAARAQRALEAADAKLSEFAAAGRTATELDEESGGTDIEVVEAEAAKKRAQVRIEIAAN
jgi:F-type H+-transporting ATPase subunit epsilon